MSESSDIQSVVARTQQAGRSQNVSAEQEEMRRKRFELEQARESAENAKKVRESEAAQPRRGIEDRDGGAAAREERKRRARAADAPNATNGGNERRGPGQGGIDVRV